jgi:hypothetical protein
MTITIEMIDELRKRANVGFEDARDALERCDGNMLEALIYLEKNNKFKGARGEEKECFFDKIKALIKKGNNIRFKVRKREVTVLNLSLTVSILIGVFAFHISVIALVIALLAGYKFKFEKNNGEDMKVNETINKMHDNIDSFKRKFAEDVEVESK